MTARTNFADKLAAAYDALSAAEHSVSFCHHMMEVERTEAAIIEYEAALDAASKCRKNIGAIHNAEMAARDAAACRA